MNYVSIFFFKKEKGQHNERFFKNSVLVVSVHFAICGLSLQGFRAHTLAGWLQQ